MHRFQKIIDIFGVPSPVENMDDGKERPLNWRRLGYARVSTHEQSLDLQRDALVKAGVDPRHIYTDVISGAKMTRPGLKRLMKHARSGDVIVVWKLDRLGRSLSGVLDAIAEMEAAGLELRSVTEAFDTTNAVGRMIMQVLLSLAEMERNMISERTKAGVAAYKARGGKMGPKHHVLDCPKRLDHFRTLWDSGQIDDMSAQDVIDELNAIDPDAPPIKRPQSFYNWKRKGFEGFNLTPDKPLKDDGEAD